MLARRCLVRKIAVSSVIKNRKSRGIYPAQWPSSNAKKPREARIAAAAVHSTGRGLDAERSNIDRRTVSDRQIGAEQEKEDTESEARYVSHMCSLQASSSSNTEIGTEPGRSVAASGQIRSLFSGYMYRYQPRRDPVAVACMTTEGKTTYGSTLDGIVNTTTTTSSSLDQCGVSVEGSIQKKTDNIGNNGLSR